MMHIAITKLGRKYGCCFQNWLMKTPGKRSLGLARTPPIKALKGNLFINEREGHGVTLYLMLPPKAATVITHESPLAWFVESVMSITTSLVRATVNEISCRRGVMRALTRVGA